MLRCCKSSIRLRLKSTRGFTLIEIMVAMMLLGVSGISLLSSFSNAARTTQSPENAAYYLAAKQLASMNEAVRNDTWGGAGPLNTAAPTPQPTSPQTVGTTTYTQSYTVNTVDVDGNASEDYRRARITVTWP